VRNAFIDELCQAAEKDPSIWLLTADLGFSVLEPFIERFPDRYLNVGIAEQNMMGIAAGLAMSGKRVFAYSIVNFATLRCLEQIRNDIVYHNADVTIVGVGGGFAYGAQGYTHHGIEDLSVMRALGKIDIAVPSDAFETRMVLRHILANDGPSYLRLSKAGEQLVHAEIPAETNRRPINVIEGEDVLIVATGCVVQEAVIASQLLREQGVKASVWSCPWVNPVDTDIVKAAITDHRLVFTAEEGVISGGLGAIFNECAASLAAPRARVLNTGVPSDIKHIVAARETILNEIGLDGEGIAQKILAALAE
jgi:transketolase